MIEALLFHYQRHQGRPVVFGLRQQLIELEANKEGLADVTT